MDGLLPPGIKTVGQTDGRHQEDSLHRCTIHNTMVKINITISNTSDQIIRVEIPDLSKDEYLMSSELKTLEVEVNKIYNVKLTQGCNVQRTKYVFPVISVHHKLNPNDLCSFTPIQEGQTIDLSRHFK